jgi:hypothetical protein
MNPNPTAPGALMDECEQMFEPAIVHVLRHRRQIERFLQAAVDA